MDYFYDFSGAVREGGGGGGGGVAESNETRVCNIKYLRLTNML